MRYRVSNVRIAERYAAWAVATALTLAGMTGCVLPRGESLLTPTDVVDGLHESLGVDLVEMPRVDTTAAFPDVEATYVDEANGGKILIIVFRSSKATVQVLGEQVTRLPEIGAMRYRNVMILYPRSPEITRRALKLVIALRSMSATG